MREPVSLVMRAGGGGTLAGFISKKDKTGCGYLPPSMRRALIPDFSQREKENSKSEAASNLDLAFQLCASYSPVNCVYALKISFEFDPAKAKTSLRNHGVSFAHAEQALRDPMAFTIEDPDSARKASRGEVDRYHA